MYQLLPLSATIMPYAAATFRSEKCCRRSGNLCEYRKPQHESETAMNEKDAKDAKARRTAPLRTPNELGANATKDISGALSTLLADVYTLYLKTKSFHWRMSGPH